jgi:hypothetical protein
MRSPILSVLPCFFLLALAGCPPASASTTRSLAPAGGVLSLRAAPASSAKVVSSVNFRGLPAGRYALFSSTAAPENLAAILGFDVDKECPKPTAGDAGVSTADAGRSVEPVYTTGGSWCSAKGIFKGGIDGRATIVTLTAAGAPDQDQLRDSTLGADSVFTLKALDGQTLSSTVTVTVWAEGGDGGCGASDESPSVDAVTVAAP